MVLIERMIPEIAFHGDLMAVLSDRLSLGIRPHGQLMVVLPDRLSLEILPQDQLMFLIDGIAPETFIHGSLMQFTERMMCAIAPSAI